MPKIVRVPQKQFGSNGPNGDFGIFGSKANPPQTFSSDPNAIQSLPAFLTGWGASIIGNYEPPMEDMNSLFLLAFRQLSYIFQEGISEYDSTTIYYNGSIVKEVGIIYTSQVDNNQGNDPALDSGLNWQQGFGGNNGAVPTGTILPWGGASNAVPSGYILGDGSAVNRTTYARLFSVIGTTYGSGNGTTTFNLPNGKGRILVGADGTMEFGSVGQVGGEKYHQLTVAELASHSHTYYNPNTANSTSGQQESRGGRDPFTDNTGSAGGDQAHNNLQPYLVIGGIIVKI